VLSSTVVKGKEEEGAKFRDYFAWSEPAAAAPSHRLLAVLRGEEEGMLAVHLLPPEETAAALVCRQFVRGQSAIAQQVGQAARDGYKRLLAPSLEKELRQELKRRADEQAICVFAENLRELLLAPPLGGRRVLALDPGFRTGCKLACLDAQGQLLEHATIYPHTGERQRAEATRAVRALCERHAIEAMALMPENRDVPFRSAKVFALAGNGTAALDALRRAVERGYDPQVARRDPELASLKSMPEFESALSAVPAPSR
jgi:uncharacterized protein